MQDFFDVTDDDLVIDEQLYFGDQEIVKFQCIDIRQNAQSGSLQLKCNVLQAPVSHEHVGKKATIYMTSKDNEVSKKIKAQFLKAFWTIEQIKSRQANPKALNGRIFTAKSKIQNKDNGKRYQNWEQFQDLGYGTNEVAPQAQAAPVQSAPAQPVTTASGPTF